LQEVVRFAGKELESDYDLAEVLVHAEEHRAFDSQAVPAYLEATASLQSDYDQRRVLTGMLEKQSKLSDESLEAVLRLATDLDSDYDLAEVLVETLQHLPANRAPSPGFFKAAESLDSDYDYRRVLSEALQRPLQKPALLSIVNATQNMSSDYDRAELLVQVAEKQGIDAELRPAFMNAARSISSEYDRGRVLSAGVEHGL